VAGAYIIGREVRLQKIGRNIPLFAGVAEQPLLARDQWHEKGIIFRRKYHTRPRWDRGVDVEGDDALGPNTGVLCDGGADIVIQPGSRCPDYGCYREDFAVRKMGEFSLSLQFYCADGSAFPKATSASLQGRIQEHVSDSSGVCNTAGYSIKQYLRRRHVQSWNYCAKPGCFPGGGDTKPIASNALANLIKPVRAAKQVERQALNGQPGDFSSNLAIKGIAFLCQAKPQRGSAKRKIETSAKASGPGSGQGPVHNQDLNLALHRQIGAPCTDDAGSDDEKFSLTLVIQAST